MKYFGLPQQYQESVRGNEKPRHRRMGLARQELDVRKAQFACSGLKAFTLRALANQDKNNPGISFAFRRRLQHRFKSMRHAQRPGIHGDKPAAPAILPADARARPLIGLSFEPGDEIAAYPISHNSQLVF